MSRHLCLRAPAVVWDVGSHRWENMFKLAVGFHHMFLMLMKRVLIEKLMIWLTCKPADTVQAEGS